MQSTEKMLAFMPVEEHGLLRDAVARALDEARLGEWRPLWDTLVDMGALAVALPVGRGGMDDAGAARVILEEIGRCAAAVPFACGVAAALRLLGRLPAATDKFDLLADGKGFATLALHESDTLPQLRRQQTMAKNVDAAYRLRGRKQAVPFGADADFILLPAWLEAENALGLFLLQRGCEGMNVAPATGIDAAGYADIDLAGARAALLCQGEEAEQAIDWLYDAYVAASCAEAVGAMRHLLDTTATYLGVRQQFGMPLSVNQALRHRFVDIDVLLTQAETAADWAASALDNESDARRRRQALVTARYTCTRAAWRVSQEAVQMHGGMGMAAETGLGVYMRRLMALTLILGDEDSATQLHDINA